ncbi:transposase [Streptomyces sp. NBC_00647]|uniref:transposase n=1 Tax=Streptomyces sp. NBC_00647 TaxID=2975796 RepID=UPI00386DADBF
MPENQGAVRPGDAKRDISPLIDRPFSMPGRPRIPDRRALCGILFVLHTGIQWEYLPQELGFGSGMTCWRRLAAWNEAVVCDEMHLVPLKLRAAKQLDWSRAVIDSSHVQAARRGPSGRSAWSSAMILARAAKKLGLRGPRNRVTSLSYSSRRRFTSDSVMGLF